MIFEPADLVIQSKSNQNTHFLGCSHLDLCILVLHSESLGLKYEQERGLFLSLSGLMIQRLYVKLVMRFRPYIPAQTQTFLPIFTIYTNKIAYTKFQYQTKAFCWLDLTFEREKNSILDRILGDICLLKSRVKTIPILNHS